MPHLKILMVVPVLMLTLGACASNEPTETQPRPDVTTFESGALDDIPLYPRSEAAGPPAQGGEAEARSFITVGVLPNDVIAFYDVELPQAGWTAMGPTETLGTESLRRRWSKEDRTLVVSATRAQGATGESESADQARTQYSLSLEPS